jgi:RNA recognition motif-containing protein
MIQSDMIKLFIVGFPRNMEEFKLKEMFSKYGEVASVKIVTEQATGRSRGYAFLRMKDHAGAVRAIELMNGAKIGGRQISVRVASDKQAFSQNAYSEAGHRLSPLPTRQYAEEQPGTTKKKRPRIQR